MPPAFLGTFTGLISSGGRELIMKSQIPTRDLIKLSAYLDGQLPPRQSNRIKKRLGQEPELKAALTELQNTRNLLRAAPRLRSTRNFTLTSAMVGQQTRDRHRFVPAYRVVSALASLLLVLVVVGEFFNMGLPNAADQVMPLMAEVQQPEVAIEAEAPAAKAVEVSTTSEAETLALPVEPTLEVAQEMEVGAAERAGKSEPPTESVDEEPATEELMDGEMAGLEAQGTPEMLEEPPVDEMPLILAAPAEGVEEDQEGETVPDDPDEISGQLASEADAQETDLTASENLDASVPQEPRAEAATEPAMEPSYAGEPASQAGELRGSGSVGWTLFRIIEVSLALVALGFGLLAWVYRVRR